MSEERQFNLMFRTSLGPVDPIADVIAAVRSASSEGANDKQIRARVEAAMKESSVYLRRRRRRRCSCSS
jgi:glycyl-tRNA synthetase